VGWWAAAVLAGLLGAGDGASCPAELFRVGRSTNANVVLYEARLSAPGLLDGRDPVHPVWVMLAEDGRREELNLVERALAYGVEVLARAGVSEAVIALRASPGTPIRVVVESGCPVARVPIGGREASLRRLHVEASGGPFPQVHWVDLVGMDPATGEEVRERLAADDRSPWQEP